MPEIFFADLKIHTRSPGAFDPMLAKVYDPRSTLLHYPVYVQPKLDGARLLWDGREFWSRTGKKSLAVPEEITAAAECFFSGIPLDGELYLHGLPFQDIMSRARTVGHPKAHTLRYVIYDMPTSESFSDRWEHLKVLFGPRSQPGWQEMEHIQLIQTLSVRAYTTLKLQLAVYLAQGYEGMMIREPQAPYAHARSSALLKWKKTFEAEGVVVGTTPGKGKHLGRIGALCVRGVDWQCQVGSGLTDLDREDDWPLGTKVVIAYQEKSNSGTPRFPRLVGRVVLGRPSNA